MQSSLMSSFELSSMRSEKEVEVEQPSGKLWGNRPMSTIKEILPQSKKSHLKKVVAYCRISTKVRELLDSLAAQESYYEERIKANPNWQFAGIYSDVGSETTMKRRKRFNALLSACRRRFAQNTLDALETIRMLYRWKVDIYFEIEDIHTL